MRVFNRLSLLVMLVVCATYFSVSANATTPQELVGRYSFRTQFTVSTIVIEPANTYYSEFRDCNSLTIETGSYTFRSGVLTLSTRTRVQKGFDGTGDGIDMLNPETYKQKFQREPPEDLNSPSYLPIKWTGRLYLIPKDGLIEFCNTVNLGAEPRTELSMLRDYYGAFYLREGDDSKTVSGLPELPSEARSFLLTNPVDAEVTSVENDGQNRTASINKGSRDGLKPEMKLSYRNRSAALARGAWVTEVGETSAKVESYVELKVGDKLSSKIRPYFDSYGDMPFESEKARLDDFAKEMKALSIVTAYIMVYSGPYSFDGDAQKRAERAKDYLVKECGINPDEVEMVEGGRRKEAMTELRLVGINTPIPKANPRKSAQEP